MPELRPERVEELRKARRLSQANLGALTGTSQASIQRIETGETRNPRNLLALARALKTSPEYLLGETDDPAPTGSLNERQLPFRNDDDLPREAPPAMVEVAGIDLDFGLGAAIMDSEIVEHQVEPLQFPRDWLRQITTSPPSQLYWTRGVGNSMEPAISDGDVILIDRSKNGSTFGDLYWAIAYGNTGMIKRLRPMPDGSVKILSDNPSVPPEVAYDGELHIFGRVIAVVRRL